MASLRTLILTGLLGGLTVSAIQAQSPAPASQEDTTSREKAFLDAVEKFGWTRQGVGKLGTRAEVAIPKGYRFTDGDGTRKLMTLTRNFPTEKEQGMLASEDASTWIIFEWEDSGYVKDDDKDQLDPDATLEALKAGTEASNKKRKELGMGELHLVGWVVPLRYNDQTKNLEWATRLRDETGGESINYNTRLLGREGVMEVTLVCPPEEMEALLPQYQSIISSFHYVQGQTYAEYRAGDKIAKYGVTGLVAGGAAVMASKMGLFGKLGLLIGKLGKGVIVLVVAIGAGLKSLFTKLFGKRA